MGDNWMNVSLLVLILVVGGIMVVAFAPLFVAFGIFAWALLGA